MKRIILIFLFVVSFISAFGARDYRTVDRFVRSLSDGHITNLDSLSTLISTKFSREEYRLRAIYGWVCKNITYDMDRIGNPASYSGDWEVSEILEKRKTICSGYVNLFIALCRRMDIMAYYVPGYTRQNGSVIDQSHAWAAVRLSSGRWALFDPTWGASVWYDGELFKRLSYDYFMVEPSDFIRDHFPFDPMWQLLYQPITSKMFYDGKLDQNAPIFFNYNDSIAKSFRRKESAGYALAIRRIVGSGITNDATQRYVSALESQQRLALKDEQQAEVDAWLYALDQEQKRYDASVEMYNQLKKIKGNLDAVGISSKQYDFSVDVLKKNILMGEASLIILIKSPQAVHSMANLLIAKLELLKQAASKDL